MTYPRENYLPAFTGGQSQKVAVSSTSAQSTVFSPSLPTYVNVMTDVECFYRSGANPTAVSDGTDQILPAGPLYRIGPVPAGHKLAFKTVADSGSVYITPES
jgi:hypothetical protein